MSTKKELLKQAQKLFDEKKYEEVIALLTDELLDNQKSAELYTQRAWAHNRLKESERAVEYVNKALNYNPQDAKAYRAMGVAFSEKMDYDKAIENYTASIDIDPVNDIAFYNRGLSWFRKNEYDLAIADFNKAIDLNPNYVIAYTNRGAAWALKKEYDTALKDCNKAIELDPKQANSFNNRGNILAIKREFDEAILDFNMAIALNPNDAVAYRNRGLMYEFELSDYQKAVTDYARAIELEKAENTDIIYNRDALLEKIKEQKQIQEITTTFNGARVDELAKQLRDAVEAILRLAIADKPETTVYYTRLLVADKILGANGKIDKDSQGRMRYYNAGYMTSPVEGRFIFECFAKGNKAGILRVFERGKRANETSVYIGSFLTNNKTGMHEDEPVMWRTYGRDENNTEAAGCSFVINESFFDKHNKLKLLEPTASGQLRQDGVLPPQGLFNVIYYKADGFLNDKNGNIKNAIATLENILVNLIAVSNACKKEEEKSIIDSFIFNYLSRISYLFKSAEYASEHEVRVVQYMPHGTELIQVDENYPPKLYIQSNKSLVPHLKKIFIGPRVQNPDDWITYLDFRIRRRERENHVKIDYDIEVRKSACSLT